MHVHAPKRSSSRSINALCAPIYAPVVCDHACTSCYYLLNVPKTGVCVELESMHVFAVCLLVNGVVGSRNRRLVLLFQSRKLSFGGIAVKGSW